MNSPLRKGSGIVTDYTATLRDAVNASDLTQEQVATAARISVRTLRYMLKGQDAKLTTWLRVLAVLGLTLEVATCD